MKTTLQPNPDNDTNANRREGPEPLTFSNVIFFFRKDVLMAAREVIELALTKLALDFPPVSENSVFFDFADAEAFLSPPIPPALASSSVTSLGKMSNSADDLVLRFFRNFRISRFL
uniref:Uncharacterized protein n=1 Tax=Romanomermis culicivorax TaxID=13658 RepID=A0A915HT92_ROMCU